MPRRSATGRYACELSPGGLGKRSAVSANPAGIDLIAGNVDLESDADIPVAFQNILV
jgi:hypothetical protein